MQRLNALKDEEMTFVAHVTGEVLKSDMPTDEELSLKPGAGVHGSCQQLRRYIHERRIGNGHKL